MLQWTSQKKNGLKLEMLIICLVQIANWLVNKTIVLCWVGIKAIYSL